MSKRSVKELFDEITSLDRIDLDRLLNLYESELGIPEIRFVRPRDVVDDRVFVRGYDVIITGCAINRLIAAKNIWHERILPDFFPSNGFVSIAKFLLDVPITVAFLPADEALESRRMLMEAGLTVKLNYRWTYFSYYEYSQYNAHQRDMFTSPPVHLIYLTCDPDNQTRNQTEQ